MMRACFAGAAALILQFNAVAATPPTFGRDVAPLLREKCGDCHAPGRLAPFSFATYRDARERAGKISRITLDGLMPPWLPSHSGFSGDRRLNAAEIGLLRRWTEAGAPEGEDPPSWPSPPNTWQLGKPDLILTMPQFHTVPADGEVQTAHFVFPLRLAEPRYLRAIEALPGNRRVVLQVNALFDRSGRARELAGSAGWYVRFGGSGFFPSGRLSVFTPGRATRVFEDGVAMTLTPDSDLVMQVRYRPSGQREMDVTRVGLYFTNEVPQRSPSGVYLGNEDLRIAPGAIEEVIRDRVTLAAPLSLREIRPTLLRFGRAVRAWAELPDGKRFPLLDIQDWNFTWQETYTLAKPLMLPKGASVTAAWTISNDSQHELRAGDTPQDEAPSLWLGGIVENWSDHVALTRANLQHFTELMNAARRKP